MVKSYSESLDNNRALGERKKELKFKSYCPSRYLHICWLSRTFFGTIQLQHAQPGEEEKTQIVLVRLVGDWREI
jgi:hypothetical protein